MRSNFFQKAIPVAVIATGLSILAGIPREVGIWLIAALFVLLILGYGQAMNTRRRG